MGFLSKIFKGVKKVVKKVGKAISKPFSIIKKIGSRVVRNVKSAFKKVAGFMGKLGPFGSIALSFLLPGIGSVLGGWANTMMASANGFIAGAGNVLNAAINVGTKIGNVVSKVSDGVTKVIGKVVGATVNAIPGGADFVDFISKGKIDVSGDYFTGNTGVLKTARGAFDDIAAAGGDLFSKSTLVDTNKYSQELLDISNKATELTKEVTIPDLDAKLDAKMEGVIPETVSVEMPDLEIQTGTDSLLAPPPETQIIGDVPSFTQEVVNPDTRSFEMKTFEGVQGTTPAPSYDDLGNIGVNKDMLRQEALNQAPVDSLLVPSNVEIDLPSLSTPESLVDRFGSEIVEPVGTGTVLKTDPVGTGTVLRAGAAGTVAEMGIPDSNVREALKKLNKESVSDVEVPMAGYDYDKPDQYGGDSEGLTYAILQKHNSTFVDGLGYDPTYKGETSSWSQNFARSMQYAA